MHEYTVHAHKKDLCWIASHGDIKVEENLGNSIFKVFLRTDVKPHEFDSLIGKYVNPKKLPLSVLHA